MKILAILLILSSIATISWADDANETLFENTCTKDEEKVLKDLPIQDLAEKLSDQAYTTFGMMEQIKDDYAWILQNKGFDHLLKSLQGKEWLRAFEWYEAEVLPKEIGIGKPQPLSFLKRFHNKSQEYLPKMHKGLKMILGGLVEMKAHGFDAYDQNTVQYVKKYVDDSIDAVKSVLCTFTKFMLSSEVGFTLPLTQSEVPKITKENNGLLYRDTIHFLSYLSQVSHFLAIDIQKRLCVIKTSKEDLCNPSWYGPEYIVENDTNIPEYDVVIHPTTQETL